MAKKIKNQERCTLGVAGWVIGLVFAAYMLILLVPYIYALFSSVTDFPTWKRSIFPFPVNGFKLDNYLSAWNDLKFGDNGIPQMILNSLWFAGGSAVLGVFLSSCGAYICAKYRFVGSKFIYWFALITMMIPARSSCNRPIAT